MDSLSLPEEKLYAAIKERKPLEDLLLLLTPDIALRQCWVANDIDVSRITIALFLNSLLVILSRYS